VSNPKTEAVELIKKLPDNVTLEEIQQHLADLAAAARARDFETGKAQPKSQTEIFAKARAVLG
jgi:hypothetical protein